MTRAQRIAIFLLLLGGSAAAFAGQRRALVPAAGQGGAPGEVVGPGPFDWPELDVWSWVPSMPAPAPGAPAIDWTWANQVETEQKGASMNPTNDPQRNVRGFLQAIAWAEGTANQPDPYRVCYAYSHTIDSFKDHPYTTGEWPGVRLTDQQCAGAGQPAGCLSTAAGKYQITVTTWRKLKPRLGLPDFSPASQDAAAIELLREVGALELIQRGDLVGATAAARRTWASLPGANYAGQGMRTPGQLLTAYLNAGGGLA